MSHYEHMCIKCQTWIMPGEHDRGCPPDWAESATTAKPITDADLTAIRERLAYVEQEAGVFLADTIALREHLRLAEAVVEAAAVYRDKVSYTGGDSTSFFAEEQDILDATLAAYRKEIK